MYNNKNTNDYLIYKNKNVSIKLSEYDNKFNNQIFFAQDNNNNNFEQNSNEEDKILRQPNYPNLNYSKYNFDNPLVYDNEFMKKNIKDYSNNDNKREIKIKKK